MTNRNISGAQFQHDNSMVLYHATHHDLPGKKMPLHAGTRAAALEAATARAEHDGVSPDRVSLWEVRPHAGERAFNTPDDPLEDDDVMALDEELRSGKRVHPYDLDYGHDSPTEYPLSPRSAGFEHGKHDAAYYTNVAEDEGSVSAAFYSPKSYSIARVTE